MRWSWTRCSWTCPRSSRDQQLCELQIQCGIDITRPLGRHDEGDRVLAIECSRLSEPFYCSNIHSTVRQVGGGLVLPPIGAAVRAEQRLNPSTVVHAVHPPRPFWT